LPREGCIRIAPLVPVPGLLGEFGVAAGPILRRFGLDGADAFANPDATIPFATGARFFAAATRASACPHFGLLVGQHGDIATLGAIGFLLQNAPDVHTALQDLVGHLELHDRGAAAYLRVEGEAAVLGYEVYVKDVEGTDVVSDCAMAIAWNIMRALCGTAWQATEVRLRRARPPDVEPYRRFFRAPLHFNAEHSCLVFSSDWLQQPVRLADPGLREHFRTRVEEMLAYSHLSFRDEVKRSLVMSLGKTDCSREQIARQFDLHPRTLNRRLKEAGTSFRALRNETIHVMARQLLRDTRRSIPAIATLLGYSDATAFDRAFTRWEGTSPGKWRRLMREAIRETGAAGG
jgi:AraC-like DNA-binding protein